MRSVAVGVLTALVLTASVAPGFVHTAEAATQSGYAGTHVSFETTGEAVTDYRVDGETVFSSLSTESRSSYESRTGASVGVDLDVSSVTALEAAAVSLGAKTRTSASVESESGANITAHDNSHGILTVSSEGEGAQLVKADLGAGAEATAAGDDRVVVTTESGETSTFVVVGDGQVTVNEDGDVVADLGEDATLVVRSYVEAERDEDAKSQERLIAEGDAAAEVHFVERDGEQVADTVTYAQDTTVSTEQTAENEVSVTVERASHDGTVVITHVSEEAVGATDGLQVRVDGETAARASSYSELRSAADDGDSSKFMVRQAASAEGSAEVLVAVNHFSTRTVTVSSGDSDGTGSDDASDGSDADGSDADGSGDGSDGGDAGSTVETPGFGAAAAVVALAGTAILARRRR